MTRLSKEREQEIRELRANLSTPKDPMNDGLWPLAVNGITALLDEIDALRDEIKRLREEEAEWLAEAFYATAAYVEDGDRAGWYDTCTLSTAVDTGNRLVELGKFERHPQGHGRRWFYRPKELLNDRTD